jgi:hypothetical protein
VVLYEDVPFFLDLFKQFVCTPYFFYFGKHCIRRHEYQDPALNLSEDLNQSVCERNEKLYILTGLVTKVDRSAVMVIW